MEGSSFRAASHFLMKAFLLACILAGLCFGSLHNSVATPPTVISPQRMVFLDSISTSRNILQAYTDSDFNQQIRIMFDTSALLANVDLRACYVGVNTVAFSNSTTADSAKCSDKYPNGIDGLLDPSCTYTCETQDIITLDHIDYLRDLVADVAAFMSLTLQVHPPAGNLSVDNANRCGFYYGQPIPANYKTPGLADTDVVYVSPHPEMF